MSGNPLCSASPRLRPPLAVQNHADGVGSNSAKKSTAQAARRCKMSIAHLLPRVAPLGKSRPRIPTSSGKFTFNISSCSPCHATNLAGMLRVLNVFPSNSSMIHRNQAGRIHYFHPGSIKRPRSPAPWSLTPGSVQDPDRLTRCRASGATRSRQPCSFIARIAWRRAPALASQHKRFTTTRLASSH